MKTLVLTLGLALSAGAAAAEFVPVTEETAFRQIVQDRVLRHRFYPITLNVLPTGQVTGSALGWEVAGTWAWQDGYFCRELVWGGDPIAYNCQLVEINNDLIRFTVDQGAGRSAAFRVQ